MGEVQEINILEMMNGAIGERVSYELAKITKNCRDLNTEAKKARTLTIEIAMTPTESRESMSVRVGVEAALFTADGNAWVNDAILGIRDYLTAELPTEWQDEVIILA